MQADIRYAVRGLWKTPGFSIVAIVVLALALAVNATMFSLVNGLFLRPLPVKDPDRLTFAYLTDSQIPNLSTGIAYEGFLALKARVDVFEDGAHRAGDTARLMIDGVDERASGEQVTGNYFAMLGVPAVMGRTLLPSDDDGDAAPAMVISEDLWRTKFHADRSVIGRAVQVVAEGQFSGFYNDKQAAYTIVGVIASPFTGTGSVWSPVAYWVPSIKRIEDLREPEGERRDTYLSDRYGRPILRRRAGVSEAQAAQVVDDVGRTLAALGPRRTTTQTFEAQSSPRVQLPFETGRVRIVPERLAAAVMALSSLVMLIAIANLIGLFSAKGIAQRSEVAIRLALGASRWSLLRFFLVQGMAIAGAAGAIGLAIAAQAVALLSRTAPTEMSRGASVLYVSTDFHIPLDWRVYTFGALVPALAGLVIAGVRARQAWATDVRGAMQSGAETSAPARRLRLRYGVVVPQIAAAMSILMLAGLSIRALAASELAEPGYDPTQVSLINFDLPQPPRAELKAANEKRAVLDQKLREFAATIGGVSDVTLTDNLSFGVLEPSRTWVLTQDQFMNRTTMKWVGTVGATPGYFKTMNMRLIRGRDFDERDTRTKATGIVSAQMAQLLWPGQDPIGKNFTRTSPDRVTPPEWIEVVGVVNDVRSPMADSGWDPTFYSPGTRMLSTVVVRGPGQPSDVMREMAEAIKRADPRARITRMRTLTAAVDEVRYPRRLATAVLATSGGVGLLLATIGLYGVVSYSVAQRRREMGVRRALGADRRDIISLVVREGMVAASLGSAVGLLLAYWAVGLANRFALPMPAVHWVAIAVVPLFLSAVVLIACLIPARRAAQVDPIVVLRDL